MWLDEDEDVAVEEEAATDELAVPCVCEPCCVLVAEVECDEDVEPSLEVYDPCWALEEEDDWPEKLLPEGGEPEGRSPPLLPRA